MRIPRPRGLALTGNSLAVDAEQLFERLRRNLRRIIVVVEQPDQQSIYFRCVAERFRSRKQYGVEQRYQLLEVDLG